MRMEAAERRISRVRWQGSSEWLPGGLDAEQLVGFKLRDSDSAVEVVAAGATGAVAVVNPHTPAGGNLVLLLIICSS
jgi:hypothetical protein